MNNSEDVLEIMAQVKSLAKKYKDLTGKPLGVTGEIAEYAAAEILGLDLADARNPGYDATNMIEGQVTKYQIKGRCVSEKYAGGQRISRLSEKSDCDFVLLVLLDDNLETRCIYKAKWPDVNQALIDTKRLSNARNNHRQLSISKFIALGTMVWSRSIS